MRRFALLLILLLAGCGGNDSPIARAAGSYPGHFEIESVDGKTDPGLIKAEQMKGNLELYVTSRKFVLDMTTPHQAFTLEGHWSVDKNRITLTTDKYKFDNPREEDQKALNLKIIAGSEVQSVFGHPVILDASEDRRKLTGLKTTLGKLIGRFEFERPIPH